MVHEMTRHKSLSERNGIICVGTLTDQKQFDNAIKTIAILKERYDRQIPLYILGNGNDKEKLQNLATELGVDKLVHLPGLSTTRNHFTTGASCLFTLLIMKGSAW